MQVNYDTQNAACALGISGHAAFKTSYLTTDSLRHFPSGKLVTFLKNNRYSEKNSANKYMLKVSKRHTGIRRGLFSKLARKISERCHWCHMDVFTANYKHISQLALVFWLLTLTSVEWYFKIEIKTGVASF